VRLYKVKAMINLLFRR